MIIINKEILKHFFILNYIKNLVTMATIKIILEGNIGSEKSTVISYLRDHPQVQIFNEPVERWINLQGSNLLDLMYKDPKKWFFHFQNLAQLTMLQRNQEKSTKPISIYERSIHSSFNCFTKVGLKNGFLSKVEYDILFEWYKWNSLNEYTNYDVIMYLKLAPEIASTRISTRGRKEETGVNLTYLQDLHDAHEAWLLSSACASKVVLINANQSREGLIKGCYVFIVDLIK